MKTYFGYHRCERCGKSMDNQFAACRNCGRESDFAEAGRSFRNFLPLSMQKQAGLMVLSLVGLTVLSLIVSVLALMVHAGDDEAFAKTPLYLMLSNGIPYALLLAGMLLLLWGSCKDLFLSFRKWANVLMGLAFAAIMVALAIGYSSLVIGPVYAALGIDAGTTNANQSALNQMILAYPAVGFIVFALIGPFTEELGYRVGLFGLSSRFGKPIGYAVTIVVFALIHFGFDKLGTAESAIIELVNLPSYLIGGVCLTIAYDKFGIECSATAHILYNSFALLLEVLP